MVFLILTLIFLFGTSILSGTESALLHLGRLEGEEQLKKNQSLFFFQHFLDRFFAGKKWEAVLFCLSFTKQILRLCYAVTIFFYFLTEEPYTPQKLSDTLWILGIAGITIGVSLLADFIMNLIAFFKPRVYFSIFAPISSFFLTIFLPLSAPVFRVLRLFIPNLHKKKLAPSFRLRDKILEILQEREMSHYLDVNDQKLIMAVISFKDRIAREVMVPRIDVFSLPSDISIEEAAKSFAAEGYSRIPIYQETVDHIIGVLLYKDILKVLARSSKDELKTPVEKLVKPVLYSPETKKISQLLQEFRSKQIHLAIVVDEYGGTEGIVTIEDILEELVGEIADEYDIGEEVLYSPLPSGGWIVDSRMSIIDIEEELGIRIPHSPEYDTIGGYIYHRAGAIPSKGWRIHHENFDLEILSSDERSIDKVRITPVQQVE